MKHSITLSAFVLASGIILKTSMVQSHINLPPVGDAGAPPSGATCAQNGCHTGSAVEDANMFTLRLAETDSELINFASIVNDSSNTLYTPGQTYFGSLSLSNGASDYGFEMVSFDSVNAQAGSFTITDATHTSLQTVGGKQYLGHKNANGNQVFNFKWTAPTTVNSVTFYYTALFGNGNNQPTGDNIYKSSVTITAVPSVSGIKNVSSVQNFNVYPTQTLSNISVKLNAQIAQSAEISLVDMSGKLVKVLHNGNLNVGENEFVFNISELPQGTYLLSLRAGNVQTAKHIVKL